MVEKSTKIQSTFGGCCFFGGEVPTWATTTKPLADITLNTDWFMMGFLFHGQLKIPIELNYIIHI